jgi:hypothetical protein
MTDDHGIAAFDSLESGAYELVVRRVGYVPASAALSISLSCRTTAEAYIAAAVGGIYPEPPLRGRVNITTC